MQVIVEKKYCSILNPKLDISHAMVCQDLMSTFVCVLASSDFSQLFHRLCNCFRHLVCHLPCVTMYAVDIDSIMPFITIFNST